MTRWTGGGVLVLLAAVAALAQTAAVKARVVGGADGSGQNYIWKITNTGDQPILRVAFRHFRADQFNVPQGWTKTKFTNPMGIGNVDPWGDCEATAESAAMGIAPGETAEFSIRLARGGAERITGTMTLALADGTTGIIEGVELPGDLSLIQKHGMTAGMGAIIIVLIAFGARRRRRAAPAARSDDTTQP